MKRILLCCCLLLVAAGLFATSLVPYRIGYPDSCKIISDDMGVKMMGKEVDSGIYFKVDTYVLYDLKGQYREVTFTAGVSDEYKDERNLSLLHFYIDGVKVKTLSFNKGKAPESCTIPLDYRKQLKVVSECKGTNYAVMTDINFK